MNIEKSLAIEAEKDEQNLWYKIRKAVQMSKTLMFKGLNNQVRIYPASERVVVQGGGGNITDLARVQQYFHQLGIGTIAKVRTPTNRLAFYAEKDGVGIRINTALPSCDDAVLVEAPRTVTYRRFVCPTGIKEEGE